MHPDNITSLMSRCNPGETRSRSGTVRMRPSRSPQTSAGLSVILWTDRLVRRTLWGNGLLRPTSVRESGLGMTQPFPLKGATAIAFSLYPQEHA